MYNRVSTSDLVLKSASLVNFGRPNLPAPEFGQPESPDEAHCVNSNTIHSFIRNGRQDSAVPSGRDHVRLKVFPVQVKVQGPLTEELLRASREFTEETTAQKFRRRLREEPLIPLGMSFCSCSDLSLSNVK